MLEYLLQSPYVYLAFWLVLISNSVQSVKLIARQFEVRHHPLFERVLPLLPIKVGAATGALWAEEFGLCAVLATDTIPFGVGALWGAVVGMITMGGYRALKTMDNDKIQAFLELPGGVNE